MEITSFNNSDHIQTVSITLFVKILFVSVTFNFGSIKDDKNHSSKTFKLVLVFSLIVTLNFAPRVQIPLVLGETVNT